MAFRIVWFNRENAECYDTLEVEGDAAAVRHVSAEIEATNSRFRFVRLEQIDAEGKTLRIVAVS